MDLRQPGEIALYCDRTRLLPETDPFSRPSGPVKRGPQPWAYGSAEAVAEYRQAYSDMLEVYEMASAKFRKTGKLGVFPAGTFAPWPWEVPTAT